MGFTQMFLNIYSVFKHIRQQFQCSHPRIFEVRKNKKKTTFISCILDLCS